MASDLPRLTDRPSIFDHIRTHLDPAGRLEDPGFALPDAEELAGGLLWAPGAMDGALGHHGGAGQAADQATAIAQHLVKACKRPSQRNLRTVYAAMSANNAIDFIDPLIAALADQQPDRGALHAVGRWLATTGAARGPVKVGIAILGVTGVGDDVGVLRALGAHEEFTLYAAVALRNGLANPESELWALATAVDGWGRIHCVERLRGTTDPEICAWILREGFRNSIMTEYLAHIAATTGGLLAALQDR